MDLLEKFSAVDVRATDCLTEADRQFCRRQQEAYQNAAMGFYQIAALWTDMCSNQKAALSAPEELGSKWKRKYLVSHDWPEISVGAILNHISKSHREFISTLVSYLNTTYHLSLDAYSVKAGLLPQEHSYSGYEETVDWSVLTPVVLNYEDAIKLILSWFDGRTFAEQGPYELVKQCHIAAWSRAGYLANFEQKKNLVKILSGSCDYGHYRGHEQWHIQTGGESILRALAYFETDALGQYPDGIDDLLSEKCYLWYDLWEFEGCKKLEKIRLFKNGRMDIRFTNEGYAREFVANYFGTSWQKPSLLIQGGV